MIKLAPSILSADYTLLGHQLDIVTKAGADYVHLDVMDGHFVPNFSIGFPIIQSLRKQSELVFDVHLMVDNPKAFIARFAQAGADIISFHVESCADSDEVYEIIGMIKAEGKRVGLALRPETTIASILEFVPYVDVVLIMSVHPGFGGQDIIMETLDKARELRAYADEPGLSLDIQMDGGINLSNVRDVLEAGVNVVVVGSAIFSHPNIHAATRRFRGIFEDYRKTKTKIVIFANGDCDDLDYFKQTAQDADFVICCDGGGNYAAEMGIVPNLVVGDLDSLDAAVKADFEGQHVTFMEFPAEKDATDLELAIEAALYREPDEIVILGGFGGRPDHFLGNVQALIYAAKADVTAFLADSRTLAFVVSKYAQIARQDYEHISLIPLEAEVKGITTSGLKYPLSSATLSIGSTIGISNKFVDSVAVISVDDGFLLAICTKA